MSGRLIRPTAVASMTEVVPMTIGYEPPTPLFVYGRFGGGVAGFITRIFLFGEPTDPLGWEATRGQGLVTGQEAPGAKVLQGFEIRVNRRPIVFSREVVAACSKGHLDIGAIEAMTSSLRLLAEKKPDELGDAAVTLQQILAGLLNFPTVGYKVNPAIMIGATDHLEVVGLPVGMRLFLTGYYQADVR